MDWILVGMCMTGTSGISRSSCRDLQHYTIKLAPTLNQITTYNWTILIYQQIICFLRTTIWHWVLFLNWDPTGKGICPASRKQSVGATEWFMCKDSQSTSEIKQSYPLDTRECFPSSNENYIIHYVFLFCFVSNAAASLSLDFYNIISHSTLHNLLFPPSTWILFFY